MKNKWTIIWKLVVIIYAIITIVRWMPIIKYYSWGFHWKIESKIKAHYIYRQIIYKEKLLKELR